MNIIKSGCMKLYYRKLYIILYKTIHLSFPLRPPFYRGKTENLLLLLTYGAGLFVVQSRVFKLPLRCRREMHLFLVCKNLLWLHLRGRVVSIECWLTDVDWELTGVKLIAAEMFWTGFNLWVATGCWDMFLRVRAGCRCTETYTLLSLLEIVCNEGVIFSLWPFI